VPARLHSAIPSGRTPFQVVEGSQSAKQVLQPASLLTILEAGRQPDKLPSIAAVARLHSASLPAALPFRWLNVLRGETSVTSRVFIDDS
jgi:hypothetical protein